MARRIAAVTAVLVALAAGLYVAALVYDGGKDDRLQAGTRIGGVPVGGLTTAQAQVKLARAVARPLHRTVRVKAAGHSFTLSAGEARVRVDVADAVRRAHERSRRGWLGARVVRELTGARATGDVSLTTHIDTAKVARFARRVAKDVHRDPVEAKVTPHASGLSIEDSRPGRALSASSLARRVRRTLTDAQRPADMRATVKTLEPKTTSADLAKKYPAYIIVDRGAHQLRLYEDLKPAHTFPIAVGKQGLETPAGLYDVQWKEKNPIWRVPNSDWAGDLAGRNIPPGPDNPIKARWLAFDGAAGIHGIDPSEYGSIGHDASHGCVRMRIPDVIVVYDAAPVGTPVYIA